MYQKKFDIFHNYLIKPLLKVALLKFTTCYPKVLKTVLFEKAMVFIDAIFKVFRMILIL